MDRIYQMERSGGHIWVLGGRGVAVGSMKHAGEWSCSGSARVKEDEGQSWNMGGNRVR